MKKILVTGFISLYLLAMLKPIAPVMEYLINYDYISKVLCINKDNLTLQCNGKCYLKMQLKESSSEEDVNGTIVMEDYPIGFIDIVELTDVYEYLNTFDYNPNCSRVISYNQKTFKPPCRFV